MGTVRCQCPACQAALQVRAELAGQQGKCPRCGAVITIPVPDPAAEASPPSSLAGLAASTTPGTPPPPGGAQNPTVAAPLSQAGAPEMLAELRRRGRSAVLVVFETPPNGDYRVGLSAGAQVRCYRTADMTDPQMLEVLAQAGRMSAAGRNDKGGLQLQGEGGAPVPFELKGDRLGSTLADFKAKYSRKAGAFHLPYCSDSSPGQAIDALRTEQWHGAAGIVHGRIDLPSESNPPTIAGIRTELLLYQFVDGRLYRITALFDTEAFHHVREALAAKYGAATTESQDPVAYVWDNGVSALQLIRGAIRPKRPSMLHAVHHELHGTALGRTPQRSKDL